MKKSSLKTEIWQLILLPAIGISLLLATTITLLYTDKLGEFTAKQGQLLTERAARFASIAFAKHEDALLQEIIHSMLAEPMVRAIDIVNSKTEQKYHSGPHLKPTPQKQLKNIHHNIALITQSELLYASDNIIDQNQQVIGTVQIAIATAPIKVLLYQTLLITTLITMACLLLLGYLASQLHAHISQPLRHLRRVVNRLIEGQLDTRIERKFSLEFQQLTDAINHMADNQEQAQKDMQLNIDQSTDDLRETLETIEVQNIQLDMARKEAIAASRIKSEFLANTSHEIRTPLNRIIGFTKLTLKTPLEKKQRENIQTIQDSAHNLMSVIDDILDFSKIESGKLVLDHAPLLLRQVVENAIESQSFEAREKNLQIIPIIDKDIPPQLLGDPLRFTQIITNLLNNAIKFSTQGTITIEITLVHRDEKQLSLKTAITDEGIGLKAEHQAQLFSAFTKNDNSHSREYGGTGLGLAICKGLVERMQGEIGVNSQIDQGACFWFTAKFGIDTNYSAAEKNCLFEKRVLICSNNQKIYHQLKNLTESWHAKTHWIKSIHDIFPTFRQAKGSHQGFHTLILDIAPDERKLPPALLSNLAQQLEWEFSCSVIICCMPTHIQLFQQYDGNHSLPFISKPISYDNLLTTLCDHLDIDFKNPHKPSNKQISKPKKNILLVDDNPANLQLVCELLKDLHVNVTTAKSGKEALEKNSHNTFDLIFMDIQMPGMDGLETTQKIRDTEDSQKRTPIVALTAHSLSEQKTDFLIAGLDDCIRKPVSEELLIHMLNRWLGLAINERTPFDAPALGNKQADATANDKNLNPPVNLGQCLSLANQKVTLAQDMLMLLLKELPDVKEQLNDAFKAGDFDELQVLTHKLYGSCCYTGVPQLRSLAGLLDKTLNAGQTDSVESTMASLNNAIEHLIRWQEGRDIKALFQQA